MTERICAQDFFSDEPPDRIIATEKECNIQPLSKHDVAQYIDEDAIRAAGFEVVDTHMDNGYRLYPDVGHAEIATGENRGPQKAAVADAAANIIVGKVVTASGLPHKGVYAHSGTVINGKHRTSGYHINYSIARRLADSRYMQTVMGSFLTSVMWGGAGIVAQDGFELSQKVQDIGGVPIALSKTRCLAVNEKPMACIPSEGSDEDIFSEDRHTWARLEVRFADAGFSKTARYMLFAATSLALRLLEHPDQVDMSHLERLSFHNPAKAARRFSKDLTFRKGATNISGGSTTWLSYQEAVLEQVRILATKIALPADELAAIPLLGNMYDQLHTANLDKGEYGNLLGLLDSFVRHWILQKHFGDEPITSFNTGPVEASLNWDRILPESGGMKFWDKVPSHYISNKDVRNAVRTPQQTRAAARGHVIKHKQIYDITRANWSSVWIGGVKINLDPYSAHL